MRNTKLLCAALAAAAMIPVAVQAADYPERHIRMVVGFPGGGGTDVMARGIAEKLAESLGKQINVENRAGNTGIDAAEHVAKAAPDGYTLMMANAAPHAISPSMQKVNFDPLKDFAGVASLGYVPHILVIHPSIPAKNVKELVTAIKTSKTPVVYGTSGYGSGQHLAAEIFQMVSGTKMKAQHFRGAGQSINYLLSGEVSMIFDTAPPVMPHIKTGKLRALAVTTAKRSPGLDVPTMVESGFKMPEVLTWYGIVAPARTPAAIINKLNTEVNKVMAIADVRQKFEDRGVIIKTDTPANFDKFMERDVLKYRDVVREAKIEMKK